MLNTILTIGGGPVGWTINAVISGLQLAGMTKELVDLSNKK